MDDLEGTPFGKLLHRFRTRARLTQARLSERLGAHRNTVSLWERGEYLPDTLTMVLELTRVLQLSEADKRLLVEARFGTASILPFANLLEPNPYFTGREALLSALHTALAAGDPIAVSQPQAISGLGGIGKTQLALAYAYRYRAHYHNIFWALAESRETLAASYLTFAEHLRLELRAAQEPQHMAEAVRRWLSTAPAQRYQSAHQHRWTHPKPHPRCRRACCCQPCLRYVPPPVTRCSGSGARAPGNVQYAAGSTAVWATILDVSARRVGR
jgi:transcriptional regulator with XRE-family HTH domain